MSTGRQRAADAKRKRLTRQAGPKRGRGRPLGSKNRQPARVRTSFNRFPERAPETPAPTRVPAGGSWWLGLTSAEFAAAARAHEFKTVGKTPTRTVDDDDVEEAGA